MTGDQPYEFLPALEFHAFSLLAIGGSLALFGDFGDPSRPDSVYVLDVATGKEVATLPLADVVNDHKRAASMAFNGAIALVGVEGDSTVGGSAYVVHVPEPGAVALLLAGVCLLAGRRALRPTCRPFRQAGSPASAGHEKRDRRC